MKNIQALQLFQMNMKTELFTKVNKNTKLEGLGAETYSGLIKSGRKRKYVRWRLICFDQKMF